MRILIGLLEHMGDIVACEPVVRYLRFNHPDAHLTWAVSTPYRELIDTNPYIDETLVMDCLTDWIKLQSHADYDRVIDLHVNYRICQHCQIPLAKRTGNPFVNAYEWFDYGALLEAFSVGAGLPRLSVQPRIYLGSEHVGAVDALRLPDEFCVVHRVSNSADKDWTDEDWKALSEIIRDELKLPIVEVGAGKNLAASPIEGAINLVNRLPILQTAEVIRRARFFLGIDSGPAHLANAQYVPGIVLLGRLGYFRQYSPYTGFYAGSSPTVKIVRNPIGQVRDLKLTDVADAVRYVNAATLEIPRVSVPAQALPPRRPWPAATLPGNADIQSSEMFDLGWYVLNHPDSIEDGVHPIDHYLSDGGRRGYNPGPNFDTGAYLDAAPWLRGTDTPPLLHYITNGRAEGIVLPPPDRGPDGAPRPASAETRRAITTISGVLGTDPATGKDSDPEGAPKVFAFYLPQFHPIPENNWAHGEGFTEWHNVIKAKPQFRGHYQPRIPGELGFYDLRAEETLREQIRLAQQHGIDGFCFYYYYFQGKRLLHTPLDNFVRSDIDAPFLLLWANENWTKRWDGGDREVIIAQHHSDEDDLAFLRQLLPLFNDRRYVKVEGKPVLMIYKTHLFPNISKTVELWRDEIARHDFPGLYLIMADDWKGELHHPRDFGFDASYEIPSNILPASVMSTETDSLELVDGFSGHIVDYPKFARFHLGRPFPAYKRMRTVMLPWDNTPRYASRAIVHVNGYGDSYRLWLLQALLDTHRRYQPDERLVFLHSWNEWCEGTYLEPDGKHGRFFLEQTRDAIGIVREALRLDASVPGPALASELLRLLQAKDEGAFRVMSSTRMQTHYAYGDATRERQETDRLRDHIALLRNQIAQLDDRCAQLQQAQASEAIRLQDQASEAIRLLAETRNSTSWRLTKPLRKAMALMRGRRA